MLKFVVVTDQDSAIGFRLAGVDVVEAASPEEARSVLTALEKKGEAGIVAINEDVLNALDEKFREKLEKLRSPIVIPIPSRAVGIDKRSYIERLLRKALEWVEQVAHELKWDDSQLSQRRREIENDVRMRGTYTHTEEEVVHGARVAWRNSAKCIGEC